MISATNPPLLTRNNAESSSTFRMSGIFDIPFYGREFEVEMEPCSNVLCDCGSFQLFLYMPECVGTKNYSFRINGDVLKHKLDLQVSRQNSGYAAMILSACFGPADWNTIEDVWRYKKANLIEALQLKDLHQYRVEFPPDIRRDPSKLVAFKGLFALSSQYTAGFRGKDLDLLDFYCINNSCECTQTLFSFGSRDEDFCSFWYDYRSKSVEIHPQSNPEITVLDALQLVEQLNTRYPGFDKAIENRNQVLRAFYVKDLENRPLPIPKAFKLPFSPGLGNVSRNGSCPCGSGKKYKRCCG